MAFKLRQSGDDNMIEEWTVSSLTLAEGDLLELDIGATAATVADASTEAWQRKGVCMEAVTSSATLVKVQLVFPDQLWEANTTNNSSASHNGDRMILTDKDHVNNTGTDNTSEEAQIVQIKPVGAAADKKILCRFVGTCSGINVDAT
jgi:hypothetical protein